MRIHATVLMAALAVSLGLAIAPAHAQDSEAARLAQQLDALDASQEYGSLAAYERLQARQAIEALANARSTQSDGARYVAQRRVQIAEVAARTAAMDQQIRQLDRERSELLVEASRRDAAQARAEAERLRVMTQIQAEEAARLRQQTVSDADAMADVESALKDVAGAQTARLKAARAREAELARQEAELMGEQPDDGK